MAVTSDATSQWIDESRWEYCPVKQPAAPGAKIASRWMREDAGAARLTWITNYYVAPNERHATDMTGLDLFYRACPPARWRSYTFVSAEGASVLRGLIVRG
jgi:hypothetical protein